MLCMCACHVGSMLFWQCCMQPVLQRLSDLQELQCIKNCICSVAAWRHYCCLYYDGSGNWKTAGKGDGNMCYYNLYTGNNNNDSRNNCGIGSC